MQRARARQGVGRTTAIGATAAGARIRQENDDLRRAVEVLRQGWVTAAEQHEQLATKTHQTVRDVATRYERALQRERQFTLTFAFITFVVGLLVGFQN